MPSFFYRARDAEGRAREGVQVAASEDEVLRTLEGAQLVPILIEARPANGEAASRLELRSGWRALRHRLHPGVRPASVALFARQLSTMVGAGLPLVRSLRSISRDHEDRHLAAILEQVADDVQKGNTLAAALARHPRAFDEVFVSLVNTGEVSGTLDQILEQTSTYLERAESVRLRVQAALFYPVVVLAVSVLVMAVMFVFVIPRFSAIYARFRMPLPWPTRVLLSISDGLTQHAALVLVALALLGAGAWSALRSEGGRLWVDRAKLRLPLFGSLFRMYAITKFARTLGMLTSSGTQILAALQVVRPVPGNRVIEQGVEQVRWRVEQGAALSRAMTEAGVFPEMLVQMTATGEETGKLDGMLARTADFYEQRVSARVQGLGSVVEPIAIVVLGVVVGAMLVGLYLPVITMGQAVGRGILRH